MKLNTQRGQVTGPVLLVGAGIVVAYFAGVGIVHGAKWVGKEAKKGGVAIVHVLKKL
jgi:hypothetical protein